MTGTGVVSAAGESPEALAEALRRVEAVATDITAFEPAEGEPTRASEIAEFDLTRHVPSIKSYIDRTSALALAAGKMALEDAGLLDPETRKGEIGLCYGTQWGCLDSMELFYGKLQAGNPRFAPPLPFSHSYANSPASVMAIELGLRGHHVVYSTGRLSGAWAILGGADAVALGEAEAVACAASDSLSRSAFRHYLAAGRLLPDDAEGAAADAEARFLLGEGGACIVLETEESASARGREPKAGLSAVGCARGSDPASALAEASRDALERAGLGSGGADGTVKVFVGTAPTAAGSEAEVSAAAALVGCSFEEARRSFLSLGLVLGETMGASSVLAAAAGCVCLEGGRALVLAAEAAREGGPGGASAVAVLLEPA